MTSTSSTSGRWLPRAALLLGLALCAWGAPVRAQVDPSQTRKTLAAAQRLFGKGRYEEALAKFQAAYAADPSAAALLGIAKTARQTDRLAEAYQSYETVLATRAADLRPDERDGAERALAELAAVTGTVKLTPFTPDAAYTVDDRALGADELARPIRLGPGRHVFVATKPGFAPVTFAVLVAAGKHLDTSLTVGPPSAPPATPPSPTTPPLAPPPAMALPTPPPPAPPPPPSIAPPAPAAAPSAPALAAAPPPPPAPVTPPPAPLAPSGPSPPVEAPPPPPTEGPPPPLAPAAPVAPIALEPSAAPPVSPAATEPSPSPSQAPPSSGSPSDEGTRVGFMLGILTLPRPVEGELALKLGPRFGVGLKGSFLPELSLPNDEAKLELKAIEGLARWFPFKGMFFLGVGFGYQSFRASIGQTVSYNELITSADMSGFFVAPELGVLWISPSGFSVGLGIGAQIPIPKDPVVTATYDGQPVPAEANGAFDPDVIMAAQSSESTVRSVARFIVKYPLPTLDLFRIGIFF